MRLRVIYQFNSSLRLFVKSLFTQNIFFKTGKWSILGIGGLVGLVLISALIGFLLISYSKKESKIFFKVTQDTLNLHFDLEKPEAEKLRSLVTRLNLRWQGEDLNLKISQGLANLFKKNLFSEISIKNKNPEIEFRFKVPESGYQAGPVWDDFDLVANEKLIYLRGAIKQIFNVPGKDILTAVSDQAGFLIFKKNSKDLGLVIISAIKDEGKLNKEIEKFKEEVIIPQPPVLGLRTEGPTQSFRESVIGETKIYTFTSPQDGRSFSYGQLENKFIITDSPENFALFRKRSNNKEKENLSKTLTKLSQTADGGFYINLSLIKNIGLANLESALSPYLKIEVNELVEDIVFKSFSELGFIWKEGKANGYLKTL